MEVIKGIPVAPGVVAGRAFILEDVLERGPYHVVAAGDVPGEGTRLEEAVAAAIAGPVRSLGTAAGEGLRHRCGRPHQPYFDRCSRAGHSSGGRLPADHAERERW